MRKTRKGKQYGRKRKQHRHTHKKGGKYVMPPYYNLSNDATLTSYTSLFPKQEWDSKKIKVLTNTIREKYNIDTKILPKSTKLYRASLEENPVDFSASKKSIVYFGLDALIAIWYGLEMWQRFVEDRHKKPYNSWYVYLHEYELTEPLEYEYISEISDHPEDEGQIATCTAKACVHPQKVLHGQFGVVSELGTELTIPNSLNISSITTLIKTRRINIIKLLELQDSLSAMEYPYSIIDSVVD